MYHVLGVLNVEVDFLAIIQSPVYFREIHSRQYQVVVTKREALDDLIFIDEIIPILQPSAKQSALFVVRLLSKEETHIACPCLHMG